MGPYDRFEYLEIEEQPGSVRPVPSGKAPRRSRPRTRAAASRSLVVDQIIGGHGSAIGEFNCPAGLAVDRQGNLYVADSYNHRIQKVMPSGTVAAIGGKGTAPGRFLNPQDVAVDRRSSSVHVLEQGNCRIQKITSDGRLEMTTGARGGRPGEFNSPMGMALDRHGCILVADTGNGRLQKLSPGGLPIYAVSSSRDRQLYKPQGVEADPAGGCYIADTFAHCVVTLDANGREVGRLGCRGDSQGEFDEPQDLALDRDGTLYVIEMANSRVQAFAADGSCVACFESSTCAVGGLESPTGIAVGPSGEIYVADTMNHRILRIVWH